VVLPSADWLAPPPGAHAPVPLQRPTASVQQAVQPGRPPSPAAS